MKPLNKSEVTNLLETIIHCSIKHAPDGFPQKIRAIKAFRQLCKEICGESPDLKEAKEVLMT